MENPWKPFKHITDTNEATVLVQGGVEEVDVLMVNYFDEGAPEFEIANQCPTITNVSRFGSKILNSLVEKFWEFWIFWNHESLLK